MNPPTKPLALAVSLLILSAGLARAAADSECGASFDSAVHQDVWAYSAGDWEARCGEGLSAEEALAAAKEDFITACLEYAAVSISAGLITEQRAKTEHCEKGIPGRNTLPLPDGVVPAGGPDHTQTRDLTQRPTEALDKLSSGIGALLDADDIAGLYGEESFRAQTHTASGGVLQAPPPGGADGRFTDFTTLPDQETLAVPESPAQDVAAPSEEEPVMTPEMSGAIADWIISNQDRLTARREDEGYWEHETRYVKIVNAYVSLRVDECKGRTDWASYHECAYFHVRKFTSGAARALAENTASTLADFTPFVGEAKYAVEVYQGDQRLSAIGVIGSISIFKPLRMFKLAKAGNLMAKMHDMLRLVRVTRPLKIVRNAKYFPSQPIASRAHVAGYATIMKAGLWDWTRAGSKITYTMDKGKKVIVNGHHRYIAAKMAGVKIPDSAFRRVRESRINFGWDRINWSTSLHATRDFEEILKHL